MKKTLAIAFGLMLIAAPVLAGPNPEAELAMHTIASFEYLYCQELLNPPLFPLDCTMIDNSATVAEMDASYGYVYVVFLAYNVTCISGVEFCIAGWPTLRGAPPTPLLNYCPEGSLVLGNPWAGGGIQAMGSCACTQVDCGGTVGFAWFIWGAYAYPTYLPVTLDYCMSGYSYPAEPHNYVLGCAPDFVEDPTVSHHGCTIWGVYPELVPYADCNPDITATDPTTWSNVKSMYK
jgi:hypothetical protein